MKTARFARARVFSFCVVALMLASAASPFARAGEAPALLVATHDPALLSALDAAFSPRGVRVALADRPLRAAGDALDAGAHGADLVWLCDLTPAPSGGAVPATALCVRPHQGTVIIRRLAVATPLSPEDAAALALSVQVALMPAEAPPPAAVARPALAAPPARVAGATVSGAHRLTLELAGGFGAGAGSRSSSLSLAAVYMPRTLGHSLGVGAAVSAAAISSGGGVAASDARGRGSDPLGSVERPTDLTLRLFARAQALDGPMWLQFDLGPAAHATNDGFDGSRRWFWSLDTFAGVVIPFGRFFAGVRAGGEYAVIGRFARPGASDGRWNLEALVTAGVGWF